MIQKFFVFALAAGNVNGTVCWCTCIDFELFLSGSVQFDIWYHFEWLFANRLYLFSNNLLSQRCYPFHCLLCNVGTYSITSTVRFFVGLLIISKKLISKTTLFPLSYCSFENMCICCWPVGEERNQRWQLAIVVLQDWQFAFRLMTDWRHSLCTCHLLDTIWMTGLCGNSENEQVNCLCEAGQGKYHHSLLALLLNWSLLAWLVGRPSFLFSSPPNPRKIM